MKKEYKKPLINIDDFEVTERIAGACADTTKFTIITNAHNTMCVLEYEGNFAEGPCPAGQPDEIICNDTYVETEGYFWS